MVDLSSHRLKHYLEQLEGAEIAVVGDVMLDRYFWGNVHRVSPEAPVPVVDVDRETAHLGGAANVATNLAGLGARPLLIGAIGDDENGVRVRELCEAAGLASDFLTVDRDRPTTTKTRIIGNNQQIARVDQESREYVDSAFAASILSHVASRDHIRGIILEDYDKGLLSPQLIQQITAFAHERKVPVFVDPKRRQFFYFRQCTVFKPNRKEVTDAVGIPLRHMDDVERIGRELLTRLDCESVLITLGAEGMMLLERNGAAQTVPTRARKVADVSGAGDTTIATLSAMVCAGAPIPEAAVLANVAAGYVVGEPGIVAIDRSILLQCVNDLNEGATS